MREICNSSIKAMKLTLLARFEILLLADKSELVANDNRVRAPKYPNCYCLELLPDMDILHD